VFRPPQRTLEDSVQKGLYLMHSMAILGGMEQIFCRACSEEAFKTWQGWPATERSVSLDLRRVPRLPLLRSGVCPTCSGTSGVPANHIRYTNVHGLGSTGLPDYFALMICEPGTDEHEWLSKWGTPYPLAPTHISANAGRRPNDRSRTTLPRPLRIVRPPNDPSEQQSLDLDL